jgi:hypothetical protein
MEGDYMAEGFINQTIGMRRPPKKHVSSAVEESSTIAFPRFPPLFVVGNLKLATAAPVAFAPRPAPIDGAASP